MNMCVNEMELENLNISYKKLTNEVGKKEEALDTLQKDIYYSFHITSSHALLANHE